MDKKEQKNLRVFGYGLTIIIAFVVIRLGMKHGFTNGKYFALFLAVLLAGITALKLEAIKPFYRVWMKGARFIGEIVNFVLLSVVFYLFFGVAGIILRLMRKDLLDERIDKNAQSYWKRITFDSQDKARYTKQY